VGTLFRPDAYTMTLSARLAQQTGATVLLLWGERLPGDAAIACTSANCSSRWRADLDAAVRQVNQEMERLIRECPSQYLWGYARYKHPGAEACMRHMGRARMLTRLSASG
jgi:KDO2-lipid IV(A) lauroyltransferase